jgi:hypothetical protein
VLPPPSGPLRPFPDTGAAGAAGAGTASTIPGPTPPAQALLLANTPVRCPCWARLRQYVAAPYRAFPQLAIWGLAETTWVSEIGDPLLYTCLGLQAPLGHLGTSGNIWEHLWASYKQPP